LLLIEDLAEAARSAPDLYVGSRNHLFLSSDSDSVKIVGILKDLCDTVCLLK
jgi:hypothetical protein